MMSADDVQEAIETLEAAGLAVWLDGGWGVDALLGRQTRPHDDLDIVLALDQVDSVSAALAALDYRTLTDERPTRVVFSDSRDRRIDAHTVSFDAEGGGIQQLPGGHAFRYPPEGFLGRGQVGERTVHSLTPAVQVRCHQGYEPDETDRHDVRLLCEAFGVPIPELYRERA